MPNYPNVYDENKIKKTAETEVSSRSLVPMTGIEPVRESLPTGF